MYPRNAASPERIALGAVVQISDGAVQSSGVTVTVRGQGGAEAGSAGTIAFGATGVIVYYTPTQAETNFTSFVVIASKTGCIPVSQTVITTASATPGKVVLSGETHTSAVIPTVSAVTGLTAANLDAAVSSRMATYTQPTGFLAATFPGTVASTTNITAATGITLTATTGLGAQTANITGNLSGSVGSVTGAVGSVTGAVGSVTGNVGGNVVGSVASVTAGVTLANGAHGGAAATMQLGGVGGLTSTVTGNLTGSVGSVTGAVGSVTGLTAANLDTTISSRMATYTQPTGFLAATFPAGTVANTTNITAGTLTTVTTATNLTTNNDKTGYGLSSAAVQAVWDALTSALTTVGSIGKKLADWTIGTAQTGDSFARLGAPAGASVSADVAAVKVDTAAVKVKTDFLPSATAGAAGGVFIAGTNAATTITTALTTTFTGNLTGSVGSVTGAVGSVTGNVGGNVTGSVGSVATGGIVAASFAAGAIDAAAIAADAIGASELAADAVAEIADAVWDEVMSGHLTAGTTGATLNGASAPTAAAVADAVWDEILSGHAVSGSTGEALSAAGGAGDPWITALPGSYIAGQAGYIVGTNINATVSSRAASSVLGTPAGASIAADIAAVKADTAATLVDTAEIGTAGAGLTALASAANLATLDDYVDTEVAAIKAKTDLIPAAPAAVGDIPTATQNADALLNRDMSAVSDTNARSPLNALRFLRNKWTLTGTTLSVKEEDDTTEAWTAVVSTTPGADPITGSDPA